MAKYWSAPHDPPSEVVANRPVANGRGVVGADGWGWVMGWFQLQVRRYKSWRAFRRLAKAWRATTGGSCRYKFHLGGSCMAFSAPEIKTPEDAIRLLREVADLIAAFPGAEVVVGGGE